MKKNNVEKMFTKDDITVVELYDRYHIIGKNKKCYLPKVNHESDITMEEKEKAFRLEDIDFFKHFLNMMPKISRKDVREFMKYRSRCSRVRGANKRKSQRGR
jgi:hypothetical protein